MNARPAFKCKAASVFKQKLLREKMQQAFSNKIIAPCEKFVTKIPVNGAFFKDGENVDHKSFFLSSETSLVVIQKITPMIQPLGIVAALLRFHSKCFFMGLST